MCVIDDAGERLLLGNFGEQCQRGQPHQESVGRGSGAQSEYPGQRVTLGDGQRVEVIQQRRAQLVEPAEGQFYLRFNAGGPGDVPALETVG